MEEHSLHSTPSNTEINQSKYAYTLFEKYTFWLKECLLFGDARSSLLRLRKGTHSCGFASETMLLLVSILLPLLVFISDGVLAARRAEPSGTEAVAHHEAVLSKQTYWDSTLPGIVSQDGNLSLEAQALAAQSGFSAKQEEARLPTIDLRPRKAHRFFKHFFSAGAFLAFLFLVHSLKSQWNVCSTSSSWMRCSVGGKSMTVVMFTSPGREQHLKNSHLSRKCH